MIRKIITIIFLSIWVSHAALGQEAEPPAAEKETKAHTTNNKNHPVAPGTINSPPEKISSESRKQCSDCDVGMRGNEIARRANEISDEDLKAQNRMAVGTENMAKVASWQFLVSIFGAIFLLWTLWETRKAASAAQKSAEAAFMSVKQNRAWVSPANIHVNPKSLYKSPSVPYYDLRLINTGGSPCIEMTGYIEFYILENDVGLDDVSKHIPNESNIIQQRYTLDEGFLANGDELLLVRIKFETDNHVRNARDGKTQLFAFGVINYKTVYDDTSGRTTFCHRLNFKNLKKKDENGLKERFGAERVPHFFSMS